MQQANTVSNQIVEGNNRLRTYNSNLNEEKSSLESIMAIIAEQTQSASTKLSNLEEDLNSILPLYQSLEDGIQDQSNGNYSQLISLIEEAEEGDEKISTSATLFSESLGAGFEQLKNNLIQVEQSMREQTSELRDGIDQGISALRDESPVALFNEQITKVSQSLSSSIAAFITEVSDTFKSLQELVDSKKQHIETLLASEVEKSQKRSEVLSKTNEQFSEAVTKQMDTFRSVIESVEMKISQKTYQLISGLYDSWTIEANNDISDINRTISEIQNKSTNCEYTLNGAIIAIGKKQDEILESMQENVPPSYDSSDIESEIQQLHIELDKIEKDIHSFSFSDGNEQPNIV